MGIAIPSTILLKSVSLVAQAATAIPSVTDGEFRLVADLIGPILKCLAILIFAVALGALIFIWLERKVSGRIQDRLGPTRVGGRFGWLQTLADGLKLLLKEDLVPGNADHILFRMAPYIVFVGSFLSFMVLPFSQGWVAQNLNIAVFYMLAVLSLEVFGVILSGYASGSKWSLFGGMREAAQVVSYEIPMAICLVLPVMAAGTMNMHQLGADQTGWFWNWYCFHDPFTFWAAFVYFVCATASCKRAPFDLAEAESELVAGFHTEYSGVRWSFFFMAEYASMYAVSGIAVTMFWGGWNGPIPLGTWLGDALGLSNPHFFRSVVGCLNFFAKNYFLVFVMMWIRWTLPRIRIDQVMQACLKYLLPISCFLLLGGAIWPVLFPAAIAGRIGGAAMGLAALALVAFAWATTPSGIGPREFAEE